MHVLPLAARHRYICAMRLTLPLLLGLAACAQFPALDGTIGQDARDAPYPQLTAAPTFSDPAETETANAAMIARIAALRARAARLRSL